VQPGLAGIHSVDISCNGHLCSKKSEPCFYNSCGSETLVHCTSGSWSYRKACRIGARGYHGAGLGCLGRVADPHITFDYLTEIFDIPLQ
jgi:hypothetical protein